jgi:hypothetical protein
MTNTRHITTAPTRPARAGVWAELVRNHPIVAALLCWKVMPITESKVEARAGVTGHNVRYVLAFSLAGVILAFFLLSLYFGLLT